MLTRAKNDSVEVLADLDIWTNMQSQSGDRVYTSAPSRLFRFDGKLARMVALGADLDVKSGFKDFDQWSTKFLEKEASLVFLAILGPV